MRYILVLIAFFAFSNPTMVFADDSGSIVPAVLIGEPSSGSVVSVAYATDPNCDEVCEIFRRQMEAPPSSSVSRGHTAKREPVRCVWVASNAPTALVLREGYGNRGPAILSWAMADLGWQSSKVGGYSAYMANICFPQSVVFKYAELSLCGEIGHSGWRQPHMVYLRKHDVKKHDPACVGGDGWCGQRGL